MKIDGLTPQQHRVAVLVARGKTDEEIRAELHIGKTALWLHIKRISSTWKLTGNARVQIANRINGVAA